MGNHHPRFSVMLCLNHLCLKPALLSERNREKMVLAVDACDGTFTVI